nr:hypothetical protein [uncultured Oscillibacter sp.]
MINWTPECAIQSQKAKYEQMRSKNAKRPLLEVSLYDGHSSLNTKLQYHSILFSQVKRYNSIVILDSRFAYAPSKNPAAAAGEKYESGGAG